MRLDLVRDVLDQQLVDRQEIKMGRVDGVVLELSDDGPPRVDHFELGFAVLARRVHPRLEAWVRAIRRRWSVRRIERQHVPWSAVLEITQHHIKLDLSALETPAFDWERWLRKHVVSRIPGSGGK
jgi:hypothetical protein